MKKILFITITLAGLINPLQAKDIKARLERLESKVNTIIKNERNEWEKIKAIDNEIKALETGTPPMPLQPAPAIAPVVTIPTPAPIAKPAKKYVAPIEIPTPQPAPQPIEKYYPTQQEPQKRHTPPTKKAPMRNSVNNTNPQVRILIPSANQQTMMPYTTRSAAPDRVPYNTNSPRRRSQKSLQ